MTLLIVLKPIHSQYQYFQAQLLVNCDSRALKQSLQNFQDLDSSGAPLASVCLFRVQWAAVMNAFPTCNWDSLQVCGLNKHELKFSHVHLTYSWCCEMLDKYCKTPAKYFGKAPSCFQLIDMHQT